LLTNFSKESSGSNPDRGVQVKEMNIITLKTVLGKLFGSDKQKYEKTTLPEVIVVLDKSGSMHSIKSDAIGGFNAFLKDQQALGESAVFTLIQFDSKIETSYSGVPIMEASPLTDGSYRPNGGTALYDAVGTAIEEATYRGVDRKVIIAILTDGEENSSTKYSMSKVEKLIKQYENEGWAFIFLAAGFNQNDAERFSSSIGISSANTLGFTRDNLSSTYKKAGSAATSYRSTGSISLDWKKDD
jgi:uncharacterized protein with von Willebrand factor type A (vWA) domain